MSTLFRSAFTNMVVFTSSGNFVVPANVYKIRVTVTAGGANGSASGANTLNSGGGGGGGGTAIKIIDVTPLQRFSVTVGAEQGNSSFSKPDQSITIGASAGIRGTITIAGVTGGGAGGNASNGDINLSGSSGSAGLSGDFPIGGAGGGSFWGPGAGSARISAAGKPSNTYGCGGSGGGGTLVAAAAGGAGFQGVVVVEY